MSSSEDQARRVDALLDRLAPLASAERLPILERERAENPEAVAEAERLLAGATPPPFLRGALAPPLRALAGDLHSRPTLPKPTGAGAERSPALPDDFEPLGGVWRGAMGVVYHARQKSLSRDVALKMILADQWASADEVRRFRQEAAALAGLQHPNIVEVFHVGEHLGRPFFVMEFCPGGGLDAKLRGVPLPVREAAERVETLARAMHAAHDKGVIHRDLKPANVLLTKDGTLKVGDFGLARRLDEAGQTASGAIVGTPAYMAPEQARGQSKQVGPAADVYALGAILYECLTGRPPFQAAHPLDIVLQVVANEPVPPRRLTPKTPRDLEQICLKCLEKAPARRYATARALADDLRRYLEGKPVLARPLGPLGRTWRWCRRKPAWATLAVVSLAALLGLGVLGVLYWRSQTEADAQRVLRAEDRVRVAEREAQAAADRTHGERVAAAENAARRGDWGKALDSYERAIADDYPDQLALKVARLPGYFVFRTRGNLSAELDALLARPDLGRHRAVVLLHEGDLLLSEPGRDKEARRFLDEALRHRADLAPADIAYAEGLQSKTSNAALERFRAALALDGFHFRANAALLTALLFRGEFDKARVQGDLMRRLYPDEPTPLAVEAWIHLLEGDRKAALAAVDRLKPILGAQRLTAMRAFFNDMGDLIAVVERLGVGSEEPPSVADIWGMFSRINRIRARAARVHEPFSFNTPTVFFVSGSLEAALWAFLDTARGANDSALKRLLHAYEVHPEPLLLVYAGVLQAQASLRLYRKGDKQGANRLAAELADTFHRAALSPTLLPRSSTRFTARVTGASIDAYLYRHAGEPQPQRAARLERLRETLRRLVVEGRPHLVTRRNGIALVVPLLDTDLARSLLADWELDEPNSLAMLKLRASVELKAENYPEALRFAERVLVKAPRDAEALKVRDAARAGKPLAGS